MTELNRHVMTSFWKRSPLSCRSWWVGFKRNAQRFQRGWRGWRWPLKLPRHFPSTEKATLEELAAQWLGLNVSSGSQGLEHVASCDKSSRMKLLILTVFVFLSHMFLSYSNVFDLRLNWATQEDQGRLCPKGGGKESARLCGMCRDHQSAWSKYQSMKTF